MIFQEGYTSIGTYLPTMLVICHLLIFSNYGGVVILWVTPWFLLATQIL